MKKILLILVCFATVALAKKPKGFDLPSQGTRDSALMMFKDFVVNGETRLGFASAQQVRSADLDDNHPVTFYYVREDSLLVSNTLSNIFIDMKKVMYPVYEDNRIRGSITFELRKSGWKPTAFQDSTEIVRILRIKKKLKLGYGKQDITTVAFLPSTKHTIYIEGNDLKNARVTSPNILDTTDAMEFHGDLMRFLNTPRIKMYDFIHGYRYYIDGTEEKFKLRR